MCEVSSLYAKMKWSYQAKTVKETVKSLNSKFDLDFNLLTPNRESSFSGHGQYICEVSLLYAKNKWIYHIMEKIQSVETKYDLVLWSFDPKINRGPSQVEVNTFVKYHYYMPKVNGAVVRKR